MSDENDYYYEFMSPIRHNKYGLYRSDRIIQTTFWEKDNKSKAEMKSEPHVCTLISFHPGRSFLRELSSYHHCDKIPTRNNLQEQRFIRVHGFQKFYCMRTGRAYK